MKSRISAMARQKCHSNINIGEELFCTQNLSVLNTNETVLGNLRGTNLLPKNLEDFKIFVKHLMTFPVHDAAVESVWKMIYPQDRDDAVSSTENLQDKREENNCRSTESALNYSTVIIDQLCALNKQNEEKSGQETTISSSSDIEVLDLEIGSGTKEQKDESDSASVEILSEHSVARHSLSEIGSTCDINSSEQFHVASQSNGSTQDDIVILNEPGEKGAGSVLKKKKKKRVKLRKLKNEVKDLKALLVNLVETAQRNICVENAHSLLKHTKSVGQENQAFKYVGNTSSREVKNRRVNQENVHENSPGTSSSSSRMGRDKFMWHDVIIDVINTKPQKRISIERLKKKVITRYMLHRGNISENTFHKFLKYLHTAPGVSVENGYATLRVGHAHYLRRRAILSPGFQRGSLQ